MSWQGGDHWIDEEEARAAWGVLWAAMDAEDAGLHGTHDRGRDAGYPMRALTAACRAVVSGKAGLYEEARSLYRFVRSGELAEVLWATRFTACGVARGMAEGDVTAALERAKEAR